MGVYFAMRKRNWKQLLLERSRRILLPFCFGIVAIVPLHFYVFQKYYGMPLSYYAHAGHLWFLGNIFAYVALLSPLFYYLKKHEGGAFWKWLSGFMSNPLGPLLVTVFFILEVVLVNPGIFEMYAQTWHGFFIGLLAFLFGFLFVYSGKAIWNTLLKWRWLYLALAIGLYLIRFLVFDLKSPGYLIAIESNCWIFGLFGFGLQKFEPAQHSPELPESGSLSGLHHTYVCTVCRCIFYPAPGDPCCVKVYLNSCIYWYCFFSPVRVCNQKDQFYKTPVWFKGNLPKSSIIKCQPSCLNLVPLTGIYYVKRYESSCIHPIRTSESPHIYGG